MHAADRLPRRLARTPLARRFASFVMSEPRLPGATGYIEQNPVKTGLAERVEEWRWSSAAGHVGDCNDPLPECD